MRPSHHDRAARGRKDAGKGCHHLRLAVPGHPGDTDDFTRADLEADGLHAAGTASIDDIQIPDVEYGRAGVCRRLVDSQQHLSPNHQFRKLFASRVRRGHFSDHAAPAHDGDAVGHGHDLPQFVGYQDHGAALIAKGGQDPEQVIGLLWCQHPGRLVEHQHLGPAVQGLEDFHALLKADRQLSDDRVRIDVQVILPLQPREFFTRLRDAGGEPRPAFRT